MHCSTVKSRLYGVTDGFIFKLFESVQMKSLIEMALDKANAWHKKACVLNATLMMSFVLLMSLRRDLSYSNLCKELVGMLRDRAPDKKIPLKPFTNEAVIKARQRLGAEPLKLLFESGAEKIFTTSKFFGFTTYGVDGVQFTMPDTKANEECYKRPVTSRGGRAAFPKLRLTPLVCTATHQIRAVEIGQHDADERQACKQLLKYLGKDDLLYMDSGFAAAWLFREITDRNIQFISRISLAWKPEIIHRNGPGDYLVELSPVENIPGTKDSNGRYKTRRVKTVVRLIEYRTKKNSLVRLVTSLLDPEKYPARELALSYHLRWETELAYDEIKTHLFTVKHGLLHTNFRSKNPKDVDQEVYGMLAAYNFIRATMNEVALTYDIEPLEISFVESLHVITKALDKMEAATPDQVPILYDRMLEDLAACRLKRSRRKRCNPRKVKVKMSNYKRKREGDYGEIRDFEEELCLLECTSLPKEGNN